MEFSLRSGPPDVPEGGSLIIALDFGTTYSGIAYAFSRSPEKIIAIANWPGHNGTLVPKVPTAIKYDSGSITSFKWGYELDNSFDDKITELKLLLDPDQPRPYFSSTNIQAEMAKLPKLAVEVTSDYMRVIFQHAMKVIASESLEPGILDKLPKQFVLTVPAVWSDKAKDLTQRAAQNAGFNPITMITEPEAAALYTLLSMKNKGLRVGDSVVICDAGGGTVDLIAYEIQSLNPFKMKALTSPSGSLCGSLRLNKFFEDEVRNIVGEEAFVKLKKSQVYKAGLDYFDFSLKPRFLSKNDPDKYVHFRNAGLKDDEDKGLMDNTITLPGETMFRIFDPVIREIDKLIERQVDKVILDRQQPGSSSTEIVKAIFLVGGFGSSAYLKKVIEESNPGIRVIQPNDAWSAIVNGAVMSKLGLAPIVTATKASKHYGAIYTKPWQHDRDQGRPTVWDVCEGVGKCEIMAWFIHKDDDLVREKKLSIQVYRNSEVLNPSSNDLLIEDKLYECDTKFAPLHPTDVKVNCSLKTDLNLVPKSVFTQKFRFPDGRPYMQIMYNLQITHDQSGLMKFSVEIDGTEYSAVEATY